MVHSVVKVWSRVTGDNIYDWGRSTWGHSWALYSRVDQMIYNHNGQPYFVIKSRQ